jgi:hypothetical protein
MFGKRIVGLLLCAISLASCEQPEEQILPVPPDQEIFQKAWILPGGAPIPHEISHWTGRVMAKNAVYSEKTGWHVEVFVVQIAKNLAFVAYGEDPKLTRDRITRSQMDVARAGHYVEFDGVQVDQPKFSQSDLEILDNGKLRLVEIKLTRLRVPRHVYQGHGF